MTRLRKTGRRTPITAPKQQQGGRRHLFFYGFLTFAVVLHVVLNRHSSENGILLLQDAMASLSSQNANDNPPPTSQTFTAARKAESMSIQSTSTTSKRPSSTERTKEANSHLLVIEDLDNGFPTMVNRKILFVHVGKAGGTTLDEAFRCGNKNGKCLQNLSHQRVSPLQKAVTHQIHLGFKSKALSFDDYTPQQLIDQDPNQKCTSLLFGLRNPITRTISAYKFLHPKSQISSFAKQKAPEKTLFYETCYPTLESLMEGVSTAFETAKASNTQQKALTECQNLGLQVLQGGVSELRKVNQHLVKNLDYYAEHVMRRFPTKEVLVIRMEHLWQDVQDLDKLLGGTGRVFAKLAQQNPVINVNPEMEQFAWNTISAKQYQQLCCVLIREITSFQQVVDRAQNLRLQDKASYLQPLIEQCQVPETDVFLRDYTYGVDWAAWHQQNCPDLTPLLTDTGFTDAE